ncbi:MAG: nucleotide exchange factor GrpE [Candidatus Sericytochromatia bacterium]|nr:nucleotide exchange factor GrpE [Candidatus Sericytochromatia bacterium]
MNSRAIDATTYDVLLASVASLIKARVAGEQALREAHKSAGESLAAFCLELLAVLDMLDAQLTFLAAQPREAPWPRLERNLSVSRNKLAAALAARGVTPIDVTLGESPDYRVCVAVERRAGGSEAGERVAEVLRSGWAIGADVLRAAEVAIAVGDGG